MITVDEGDHFAGGVGKPQPGADNLIYDHRTCTVITSCPTNQIGEVGVNIKTAFGAEPTTDYDIHFDDAPAVYVNGQPGRTDPTARSLERFLGSRHAARPVRRARAASCRRVPITTDMADTVELKALHMINTDPQRTPTFVLFGNPDFFFQTTNPCTNIAECVTPGFAWNHGDIQQEIGNTWVGMVGPGIASNGIDSHTWTDHTNLRPDDPLAGRA